LRVAGADWPSYPAPPAREVLPRAEALRRLGEEAGALRPWLDYVEPLAGPIQFSLQREPVEAVLLTLPRVPAHLQARYEYLLRTHCLPGSPQGPPWLSQLGFGADGSGLVTTFPSPAGFVRLVRALRGTGPAWRPALVAMNGALAWERPWLEAMAQGTALINMPARTGVWLRVVARQAAVTRRLSMLRRHLHGLLVIPAHDLTQHCVLQHAVPADHVAALGEPVLRLLRDAPGPAAPKPLVILMDTDLPQACQRAWQACLVPEDFAIAWRREWPGLHDLLRERAAQTRRLGRLAGWYLGRHDPRDQQLALS
jgi:hypothetical protein